MGHSLDDVLRAFLLQDPKLEAWLVEQAEQFAELTEKTKTARLRKLDAEIAKLIAEAREHAKAAALAEVERQFGGVAT
jgi:hypothetical protein